MENHGQAMTETQDITATGGQSAPPADVPAPEVSPAVSPAPKPKRQPRKRHRTGLMGRLVVLAIALALAVAAVSLSGKPIPLPVWMVAEVEARINRGLSSSLPDAAVSIGAVDLTVDGDWVPRFRLEDLRLLKSDGAALLTLPDVQVTLVGKALLSGQAQVKSLRLTGAQVAVTRDREGRFDIALGTGQFAPEIRSFAELFDLADAALATPAARSLQRIEAEALTLVLTDQRTGRTYAVGDGRVTLENRADALAGEFSLSMQGSNGQPGHAVLTLVSPKGAATARLTARIEQVAAQDLAAQAALLAPLGILDAPISGRLSATLAADGITELDAELQIGKGVLQPTEAAQPVAFNAARIALTYDAAAGRVALTEMQVDSPSLRFAASGQSYLVRADGSRLTGPLAGELPASFLTQFSFSEVMVDPEGLFAEPVRFSAGAFDTRLSLNPFLIEIGQLSLAEDQRRLSATGRIGADAAGWSAALDLKLNEIAHDRLLALWPTKLLPKTREWVGANILKATVFDVEAALRIAPGAEPRLHLGYSFADAEVRFLRTLPPITAGFGYSTIDGPRYTMVLSRGTVTAPQGGDIDAAGSVFAVPDVTQKPARAEIQLSTRSSLTAALSLLDLPPFNFMTKADRPVDLGQGEARFETTLNMPLQKKIALADVSYDVKGTVRDFQSDQLVPKRVITSEVLEVTATPQGLSITGPGKIGAVAFDVTYAQGFGAAAKGRARIDGTVVLSQAVAEEFGLGLPAGMVSGAGQAQVEIDLIKGQPGQLKLVSDLNRIGLTIPEVGWTKPAASTGRLEAEVTLGTPPKVNRLTLNAGGLKATGSVTMRAGGGLDLARFDRVELADWLDGTVEIKGRGAGRAVGLAVTGGTVDLRNMPGPDQRRAGKGGQGSGPLTLALDRLVVSSGIALTGFRGDFSLTGGFSGDFTAQMNDGPGLRGTVVPSRHGTAVRILSDDAGGTVRAAGIFQSARGGRLDVTLTPNGKDGQYDGRLNIAGVRVKNASVLAELLNAISVVGILEQLNGEGLVFNEVEGSFLLTPKAVEVKRGAATGASLGVSMAGVYQSGTGKLAMQGVISPVYILNGIGAAFTKRGEGVFGFNYALRGTASNPQVDVNPLSILTPGMFREIFQGKAPVLGEGPDPEGAGN